MSRRVVVRCATDMESSGTIVLAVSVFLKLLLLPAEATDSARLTIISFSSASAARRDLLPPDVVEYAALFRREGHMYLYSGAIGVICCCLDLVV